MCDKNGFEQYIVAIVTFAATIVHKTWLTSLLSYLLAISVVKT